MDLQEVGWVDVVSIDLAHRGLALVNAVLSFRVP